jgi:hypothetical protein
VNSDKIGYLYNIRITGDKISPVVWKQFRDAIVAEQCKEPGSQPSRLKVFSEAMSQRYAEQQDIGRELQIEKNGEGDNCHQRSNRPHAGKASEEMRYPVKSEYAEKKGADGAGEEQLRYA